MGHATVVSGQTFEGKQRSVFGPVVKLSNLSALYWWLLWTFLHASLSGLPVLTLPLSL